MVRSTRAMYILLQKSFVVGSFYGLPSLVYQLTDNLDCKTWMWSNIFGLAS